mmetsp:Transcript_36765/g.50206  ORF Transcript_36765/g.50206 Transcript_36765/m.50206 type:complete len:155 (+) Transcript_36765:20-484(+)
MAQFARLTAGQSPGDLYIREETALSTSASKGKGKGKSRGAEKAPDAEEHRQQEDRSGLEQGASASTKESYSSEDFPEGNDSQESDGSTTSSQTQSYDPAASCRAGACRPCGFFLRPSGCSKGAACTFCHTCKPKRFQAAKTAGKEASLKVLVSL